MTPTQTQQIGSIILYPSGLLKWECPQKPPIYGRVVARCTRVHYLEFMAEMLPIKNNYYIARELYRQFTLKKLLNPIGVQMDLVG